VRQRSIRSSLLCQMPSRSRDDVAQPLGWLPAHTSAGRYGRSGDLWPVTGGCHVASSPRRGVGALRTTEGRRALISVHNRAVLHRRTGTGSPDLLGPDNGQPYPGSSQRTLLKQQPVPGGRRVAWLPPDEVAGHAAAGGKTDLGGWVGRDRCSCRV
jgi:hypothetical protein